MFRITRPMGAFGISMACGLCALMGAPAAAQTAPNPIVLYLGEGTGNAGDTVQVGVELGVGNTRPLAMVVWLFYDADKLAPDNDAFEFVAVDLEGQPILDEFGNTFTTRSAVRREQGLLNAGKQVDTESYPEGVLGIAIQGLNSTTIAPGNMMTVAFKVLDGVSENEVVPVRGAEAGDPVQFMGSNGLETVFSSATYEAGSGETNDLEIEISDGRVVVPCTPPAAPTGVTATQGAPDAVTVSWNASGTVGATYRVYRSETSSFADAVPLGSGPTSQTTFADITALAPVQPVGCSCNATPEIVHYFYWVRTVSAAGCESTFSDPAAEGYRGSAKTASAVAKTVLDTLPSETSVDGRFVVAAGGTVAVRLESAGAPWATAESGDWTSSKSRWVAEDAGSGWAAVDLPSTLAEGAEVRLTAGANDAGTVVRTFVVSGKAQKGLLVADLGLDSVPYLPEGVGSVYEVAPAGLWDAPATVYLPVPGGEDAESLKVYVYVGTQGDRRWYLGENVAGWLASTPVVEQVNGQPHVKLSVRHGAVVQLGVAPASAANANQAAMAPRLAPGDALVVGLLGLAMVAARRRFVRIPLNK